MSTARALRAHLHEMRDPGRARAMRRFFKTDPGEYGAGDRFLGVPVPALRRLARDHESLDLRATSTLLSSPWHEERAVALFILVRRYERGTAAERTAIHRLYLERRDRVNNWDLVDCSAAVIVGQHLDGRPRALLKRLAASRSVWDRRIAIIATFHFIKHGDYAETLELARRLLADDHDLIHKAVGWMLREVANRDRPAAERFLRAHAREMPRTMLRYAIEKFPAAKRREYLGLPRPQATGLRPQASGRSQVKGVSDHATRDERAHPLV